jgi:hypothetical protein
VAHLFERGREHGAADIHARDQIGSSAAGPGYNYNGLEVTSIVDALDSDNNRLTGSPHRLTKEDCSLKKRHDQRRWRSAQHA